jgi:cell cycle sensor histidine kinase DivJ
MTVQSKIDEGTTVTVALPLTFMPQAEQPSSNIATLTPASRAQDPSHQDSAHQDPAHPDPAHQVKKSA